MYFVEHPLPHFHAIYGLYIGASQILGDSILSSPESFSGRIKECWT